MGKRKRAEQEQEQEEFQGFDTPEPTNDEVLKAKWVSLHGELRRSYLYSNGMQFVIEMPISMSMVNEHRMIIVDARGSSHILPRQYFHLTIETLPGVLTSE
jgi:hypothetical protein